MICQSCNQNLATVHLTEIVQKTKQETHLCEECAKQKGVTYTSQFSVKDFLSGLTKKPEGAGDEESASPEPADAADAAAGAQPNPKKAAAPGAAESLAPCPSCGISFSEFRQSGRLGCHQDYDHFRVGLTSLLEKIHGKTQHTGRVPSRVGERIERERQLAAYQNQLRDAIESENYERAADLRDRIESLKTQVGERA